MRMRSSPSQAAISRSSAASGAMMAGLAAPGSACAAWTRRVQAAPVGLEVDPRHEAVAEQERQHVVAVHALVERRVDLDADAEAEQRSVRSRSQISGSNGASSARASMRRGWRARGVEIGRRAPSPRPMTGRSSPASTSSASRALASAGPRAGNSRAGRARWRRPAHARRCAAARAARRPRSASAREHGLRQHALGQVVDALEGAAPRGRRDSPAQNSHSIASLPSVQPHQPPSPLCRG